MSDGIDLLSDDQKLSLFALLNNAAKKNINLDNFLSEEIKSGTAPRDNILDIYIFRMNNTSKANIKSQLIDLVNNLSTFIENEVMLTFFGEIDNRTIAFSDSNFQVLVGTINKNAS